MNTRAAELGIGHPLTRHPRSRDDLLPLGLSFPVILKPTVHDRRNRFVDAKAWRADDEETLIARYDEAVSLVGIESVMIQELIPGGGEAQFSYAAVWDRGKPVGSLVARRWRQYPIVFGVTSTFVETAAVDEIEEQACRFLGSLGYSGLVEIEFKYDTRDGCYKILDVNARAWAWIALGAAAGIDFPSVQWELAIGVTVTPHKARNGATWRYLSRDLAACAAEMAARRLPSGTFMSSLRRSSAAAVFSWTDPWPGILDVPLTLMRLAALRRRGNRIGVEESRAVRHPGQPRVSREVQNQLT
jgi:predicted ATP-grasp superfamily ATP-dependent carboligase